MESIALFDVRERLPAIFGEHGSDHVHDDIQLGLICSCYIDENVPCVQRDLAVLRVDNGRHGKNTVLRVVNDGVDWGVSDNVQISSDVFFRLKFV